MICDHSNMIGKGNELIDKDAIQTSLSVNAFDTYMKAGDPIVLFANQSTITFVPHLTPGSITNMKFGNFHHIDMIGKKYGSKIRDKKTNSWVAALRPSPHFITNALQHRTQIIYHADIYTVLMLLDAKPGDVIIESGTGSGSLTTHLAHAVTPMGKVLTYEFHQARFNEAKNQFQQYKLGTIIQCYHRDVCMEGFDVGHDRQADAMFLDLPQPWKALPHHRAVLKPFGRVVTFSPCIEQIQKTNLWLKQNGFQEIRIIESLSKAWRVTSCADESSDDDNLQYDQQQFPMRGHTSYLLVAVSPPQKSIKQQQQFSANHDKKETFSVVE